MITIRPGEAYWIEAEDGTLTLPLGEEYGEDASGCGYIASYMYNYTEPPAVDAAGMVYVDIDVAQAGMYYIWARGNSPDVNHDSYWLQIDQGYAKRFQTQTERYGQWVWRVVNGEGSENQPHYLVQGQHRIKLGAREAYAKLDALVITSLSPSSYSPNDSMIAVCQGVSGECQSNATLSMSTWIGGNNVGMPQNIRYYQGCDWQESGPELVYSFWAAQNGEMLVELQNLTADLDLFVMSGDCNAFSCVAFGDSAVRFYANQGAQYFVAVDGYAGAVGTYQIRASYAATPPPTTATPTRTPTRTPAPITPTPEPVTTRILQADDYQNYIPGVLAALRNQNEIGAVRLDAGSQPCKLQAILLFTTAYAARDRNLGIAETLRFAVFDREKRLIWDTRDSPQGDPRISVPANPSGEPRNLDIIRYDLPNPIDLGPGEFYIAVRWPEGSNPENVGDGQGVHIWGEIIGDPHHRSFYGSWGASGTVPDVEAKPEINGQKRHVDLILRAVVTP